MYFCFVFLFRKGSIVAEFKLIFNTKVQREEALDMMKVKINDGNLGRLRVDPATLKPITDGTEGNRVPHGMNILLISFV